MGEGVGRVGRNAGINREKEGGGQERWGLKKIKNVTAASQRGWRGAGRDGRN